MYESLREHFDVVVAVMIAAVIAIHAMVRARFVAMEKKIKDYGDRITELEAHEGEGMESILAEVRVIKAEVKAELSGLRAWIAENYKRRTDNGEPHGGL